jgi:hypothetical protein
MAKLFWYDGDAPQQPLYIQSRRHYGFFRFAFDCFMTAITCGFWLLWVFVREMRRR